MKIKEFFKRYSPYIISIAIALGVGLLSAFITMEDMDIYQRITKPPLAPPGALFPIVWTILYTLMGISAARIYIKRTDNPEASKDALTTYAMSLVVNFAWSIIFFSLGAYIVAFVWLLFLLALIIATIVRYFEIDRAAALLQIPYAIWVAFAGYLNLAIFILNT